VVAFTRTIQLERAETIRKFLDDAKVSLLEKKEILRKKEKRRETRGDYERRGGENFILNLIALSIPRSEKIAIRKRSKRGEGRFTSGKDQLSEGRPVRSEGGRALETH